MSNSSTLSGKSFRKKSMLEIFCANVLKVAKDVISCTLGAKRGERKVVYDHKI